MKMATPNGKMQLIWSRIKSMSAKSSKILGTLPMKRGRLQTYLLDTRKSEFTLVLMSTMMEDTKQGLLLMATYSTILNSGRAEIGNAYLESCTDEKICTVAGPVFGELQGHLLLINRELYGIRSAGARWHDRHFDVLSDTGFPDIWMRLTKDEFFCL